MILSSSVGLVLIKREHPDRCTDGPACLWEELMNTYILAHGNWLWVMVSGAGHSLKLVNSLSYGQVNPRLAGKSTEVWPQK